MVYGFAGGELWTAESDAPIVGVFFDLIQESRINVTAAIRLVSGSARPFGRKKSSPKIPTIGPIGKIAKRSGARKILITGSITDPTIPTMWNAIACFKGSATPESNPETLLQGWTGQIVFRT
jgi:hypothetical protein